MAIEKVQRKDSAVYIPPGHRVYFIWTVERDWQAGKQCTVTLAWIARVWEISPLFEYPKEVSWRKFSLQTYGDQAETLADRWGQIEAHNRQYPKDQVKQIV